MLPRFLSLLILYKKSVILAMYQSTFFFNNFPYFFIVLTAGLYITQCKCRRDQHCQGSLASWPQNSPQA